MVGRWWKIIRTICLQVVKVCGGGIRELVGENRIGWEGHKMHKNWIIVPVGRQCMWQAQA